jgi:hypothetical protein
MSDVSREQAIRQYAEENFVPSGLEGNLRLEAVGYGWDVRDKAAREDDRIVDALIDRILNRMGWCQNRQGHGGVVDCPDCWRDRAAITRWRERRSKSDEDV